MKTNCSKPSKYFLLDTNVLVGFYIEEALSQQAQSNIKSILESCRAGKHPDWFLLVPNIVIAEVFSTFAKWRFAKWNPHVKKVLPSGIGQRRYKNINCQFHNDIHNGHFFHQVELNRYHILGVDLIAPIDHYFLYYKNPNSNKLPMQTSDMLILSIGINLNHQFGKERFSILTSDRRMSVICEKARAGIKPSTVKKLGILKKAEELGFGYSPEIFPQVVNLAKKGGKQLKEVFGEWPLTI